MVVDPIYMEVIYRWWECSFGPMHARERAAMTELRHVLLEMLQKLSPLSLLFIHPNINARCLVLGVLHTHKS